MIYSYPACFFKEPDGYSVIFPDLNSASTCGATLDEAMQMSVDCMASYIYDCMIDGEELPKSSSVHEINLKNIAGTLEIELNPESFVNMIMVDVQEYAKEHFEKSMKKNVTIPIWLNDRAVANGLNFSALLQDAIKRELHILK